MSHLDTIVEGVAILCLHVRIGGEVYLLGDLVADVSLERAGLGGRGKHGVHLDLQRAQGGSLVYLAMRNSTTAQLALIRRLLYVHAANIVPCPSGHRKAN